MVNFKSFKTAASLIPHGVENWDAMKDKVEITLRGKENFDLVMSRSVHSLIEEDMVIFYVFRAKEEDGVKNIIYIPNKLMQIWGITKEELREAAIANTAREHPAMLEGLVDHLAKILKIGVPECFEEHMWVATNNDKEEGACVIMYPGFLNKTAAELEDDLFIIPTSIHEVIILKAHDSGLNGRDIAEEFKNMIPEVNSEYISPMERLSNIPYHYDREKKLLETVDNWLKRPDETLRGEWTMEDKAYVTREEYKSLEKRVTAMEKELRRRSEESENQINTARAAQQAFFEAMTKML